MLRAMVALLVVTVAARDASAGWRCIKKPQVVFSAETTSLDEDGRWRRRGKDDLEMGRISYQSVQRVEAMLDRGDKSAAVLACLDALIKDEKGADAKRLCPITKKKR